MAKYIVDEADLTDIANAIRSKYGNAESYTLSQMSAAISRLPTSAITNRLDFSNWNKGMFTEYFSDGSSVDHAIEFDENGVPTAIDGIALATTVVNTTEVE